MIQQTCDRELGPMHQDVWVLLPRYVNQTLEGQKLAHVEQHLAQCQVCQSEVARWHRIATAAQLSQEATAAPAPERLTALTI